MQTSDMSALFARIAQYAVKYRAGANERLHRPVASFDEMRERFTEALPQRGAGADAIVSDLIERAEPGLAAMTGPRFFG